MPCIGRQVLDQDTSGDCDAFDGAVGMLVGLLLYLRPLVCSGHCQYMGGY